MTVADRARLARIVSHALTARGATDEQRRKEAEYDLNADLRALPDAQIIELTQTVDLVLAGIAAVLKDRQ